MKSEQVLSISHLTKQYTKGVLAVDDVSFSLERGEIFGLLGPNGSGKTTTILMILGLLESSGGEVDILGCNPLRTPLTVKRQVGYMPDTIGFYDYMTAYENIDYTARFLNLEEKERKRRVEDALDKMHLSDRANDKVKTYSHGMKRRLGLAELLVKHPKIAILDEPTQGLDPQSISGFLATIRSLRDSEGMTFLLSSHQLNEVQSVCDKVGLFSKGKLISSGTVDELSKKYFGSNLLINVQVEGKSNLFKTFASLGGIVHVERKGDSLWLLECLEDVRAQIAETVFASKEKLVSLELLTHSLNDIYQQAFQEVSSEKA